MFQNDFLHIERRENGLFCKQNVGFFPTDMNTIAIRLDQILRTFLTSDHFYGDNQLRHS